MRAALGWLAAGGPTPFFPVAGLGAREAVQDLQLLHELRITESPRAASVLLVAGGFPDASAEPLARVHDALPHPRATVWWPLGAERPAALASFAELTLVQDDVSSTITRLHRELIGGSRPSEPPILPDVDAAPWRGEGPYGQGGSGMTGGTPYGRPMAELAPDRDGLRLDVLPVTLGPFAPGLPSGLVLELTMAGDVVVEASAPRNLLETVPRGVVRPGLQPFLTALTAPVPIAELELSRAREHLRWVADALTSHGLPSLGLRVLRLATRSRPGDGDAVRRLARMLGWTQVLRWSTAGIGRIPAELLSGLGAGPAARASGLREEARLDDPAYQALAFEPIVHQEGDAAARWQQRLAEAAQSLDLAARATDLRTEVTGRVESPRGRLERGSAPSTRIFELIPDLIEGLEWGDAFATLISLDLDLEAAALVDAGAPTAVGR